MLELAAAIHWNFRSPFDGTFGGCSSELLGAVHRNFRRPFDGTFGRHSTELSAAIHRNFLAPFTTELLDEFSYEAGNIYCTRNANLTITY